MDTSGLEWTPADIFLGKIRLTWFRIYNEGRKNGNQEPWMPRTGAIRGRLCWKMWEKAIDYGVKVSYYLSPLSGGVAQLVRALPCHGRGYGFEPRRSRHFS